MSKYTIIHGQLYELPDDELMHWKYIKREKVNDKWVYTYDNGQSQKKAYEQAKKAYDSRKAQVQSAYRKKLPVAGGLKTDGNVAAARNYNTDSISKRGSTLYNLEKKMNEAKAAYDNTPLAKREARAEKTKQNVNKVKNWAKDKLGYDEKQAMETAKTNAKVQKNKAIDVESKNNKWKIENTNFDPYTGEASKKPGYDKIAEMADWQTNFYKELAKEAEDKYIDTIEEYKKTPLGKIENMQKRIDSAKEWVKNRTGATAKENLEKTEKMYWDIARELTDVDQDYRDAERNMETASYKRDIAKKDYDTAVEYSNSLLSGEYYKKQKGPTSLTTDVVGNYKKSLEKVETTRKAFEDAQNDFIKYAENRQQLHNKRSDLESQIKTAKIEYDYAKAIYDLSPAGKREEKRETRRNKRKKN